ncbi:MAG: hypothetical protein ACI9OJ_000454, partial [Myxococcota bacterium]
MEATAGGRIQRARDIPNQDGALAGRFDHRVG